MEFYSKEDLIENLFQVINLKNNYALSPLNSLKRDIISTTFYQPLETIFSNLSPSKKISFTKFYLPKQSVNGLFPDKNHYYLVSLINNHKVLTLFISTSLRPVEPLRLTVGKKLPNECFSPSCANSTPCLAF